VSLHSDQYFTFSNDGQPTKEASAARKRLLEAFAQYDSLSKRISQLPCPGGSGSSQYRVQMAIHTRANLFLQQNMFPLQVRNCIRCPQATFPDCCLQSLPKPQKAKSKPKEEPAIDPDSELAHTLQPLLEQEALLESFVEEANAHRKFEDAKTLKANLLEIRAEIDKIFANADVGNGRSPGKPRK
jgi:rabenosyn-5